MTRCFGWIDSRPRRLDTTASLLPISPRRPGRTRSGVDKIRVALAAAGGAGEAAIACAEADGSRTILDDALALRGAPDLLAARTGDSTPKAAWPDFPPSHRRAYLEWVAQAKRPATRAARIGEIASRAARAERAITWKPRGETPCRRKRAV